VRDNASPTKTSWLAGKLNRKGSKEWTPAGSPVKVLKGGKGHVKWTTPK